MKPEEILTHHDSGELWPADRDKPWADLAGGYATALQVNGLRVQRGEQLRGYKIGFTNRSIWPKYGVDTPIWGAVWDSSLSIHPAGTDNDAETSTLSLAGLCQPRIEPEVVFGFAATPPANADLQQLYEALEWVAPGFEIVQSHQPNWQFTAAQAAADGALHARLHVGQRQPVAALGGDARTLHSSLARAQVELLRNGQPVETGQGMQVLDSPLQALHHFLQVLRQTPGAQDIQPGDTVTTGTWTDAWPVLPGEHWSADFGTTLPKLELRFSAD